MKFNFMRDVIQRFQVAPCAGAWIEIRRQANSWCHRPGRPLRGGVD